MTATLPEDDDIGSLVQQTLSLLNQDCDNASYTGTMGPNNHVVKDHKKDPSGSPRDTDMDDLVKQEPTNADCPPVSPHEEEETDVPLGSSPPSPEGRMLSVQLTSAGLSDLGIAEITADEAPEDSPDSSRNMIQRKYSWS